MKRHRAMPFTPPLQGAVKVKQPAHSTDAMTPRPGRLALALTNNNTQEEADNECKGSNSILSEQTTCNYATAKRRDRPASMLPAELHLRPLLRESVLPRYKISNANAITGGFVIRSCQRLADPGPTVAKVKRGGSAGGENQGLSMSPRQVARVVRRCMMLPRMSSTPKSGEMIQQIVNIRGRDRGATMPLCGDAGPEAMLDTPRDQRQITSLPCRIPMQTAGRRD
jgi:hypothetical protein